MGTMLKNDLSCYRLVVSSTLEGKIRYLCERFKTKEWSGNLFYTISGTFKDKNLVIRCEDLYLQDIGNGTFTSYQNNADTANYMLENDLFDCEVGVIHSHNQMQAFLSSTDLGSLKSDGEEQNHNVSLVVNNAGSYVAAITRRISYAVEGKRNLSFNTFNNETVEEEEDYATDGQEVQYFMLQINVEEANADDSIAARVDELEEQISRRRTIRVPSNTLWKSHELSNNYKSKYSYFDYYHNLPYKSLFGDDYDADVYRYQNNESPAAVVNKKLILNHAKQLLTGSIHAGNVNLKISQYEKTMTTLFRKRFRTLEDFMTWAEAFIDVLYNELPVQSDITTRWARDLQRKLRNLGWTNEFIECYIEMLNMYGTI